MNKRSYLISRSGFFLCAAAIITGGSLSCRPSTDKQPVAVAPIAPKTPVSPLSSESVKGNGSQNAQAQSADETSRQMAAMSARMRTQMHDQMNRLNSVNDIGDPILAKGKGAPNIDEHSKRTQIQAYVAYYASKGYHPSVLSAVYYPSGQIKAFHYEAHRANYSVEMRISPSSHKHPIAVSPVTSNTPISSQSAQAHSADETRREMAAMDARVNARIHTLRGGPNLAGMDKVPHINQHSNQTQIQAFITYLASKGYHPSVLTAVYFPSGQIKTFRYNARRGSSDTAEATIDATSPDSGSFSVSTTGSPP